MLGSQDMKKMLKNARRVSAAQKGRGCGGEKGLQSIEKLFLCHNTVQWTESIAPFPGVILKIL